MPWEGHLSGHSEASHLAAETENDGVSSEWRYVLSRKAMSLMTRPPTRPPWVACLILSLLLRAIRCAGGREGGREGEEKAGEQGHAFHEPPPPTRLHLWDNLRPSQRAAAALMMKMASSFIFPDTRWSHSHVVTRPSQEAGHKHTCVNAAHAVRSTRFCTCHINSEALSPERPWSD